MKIERVEINNYKSLGDTNNSLLLSDETCIIGKNESGKTNIIEALSNIKMRGGMITDYFKKNNRANDEKISLKFYLSPYKSEKQLYKKLSNTEITITGANEIYIEGGISEIILSDSKFIKSRDNFFTLIDGIRLPFTENGRTQYNKFVNYLRNIDKQVLIYGPYVDSFINEINRFQLENKEEIIENINNCIVSLVEIYELFPTMFFVNSDSLKTEYKRDELLKPKEAKDVASIGMLYIFLEAADIEYTEIEKYWDSQNGAVKKDLLDKFNNSIENSIVKKFNEFYTQNSISCSLLLDNKTISILIKTDGKSMEFSERSNGLKWYFNTFIKMIHSNLKENNIVYLLDEPGISLHVNAQKELLKFFRDLSSKQNQVIYTTHSPYMINQDDMGSVRLVAKENSLFTSISNSYNSFPVNSKYGSQETLTPLLQAIGMDLKYNIGPDKNKINIVVEGIADFYYLNAFIKQQKKKDNNIYIIPSVGASQINKLVSILIGWGYDYRILLDNDDSGRKEFKVLINKLQVNHERIIFTNQTRVPDTGKHEIENVLSLDDYNKIIANVPDYNDKKKIVALDVYNRARKGQKVFDDTTMKNIEELLKKSINML